MSESYRVSVVGGSGYTGGELLRIIKSHSQFHLSQATSNKYENRKIGSVHPHLRDLDFRFDSHSDLDDVDIIFSATPKGVAMNKIDSYMNAAEKIVDLSSDFRLNSLDKYEKWYGEHKRPDLLREFEYALPEINRENLNSDLIAAGGCNATASILGLYPFRELLNQRDNIVIDAKVGSSESGTGGGRTSNHSERTGIIRPYAPKNHRHQAEINEKTDLTTEFTAHAVQMVRGTYATIHILRDQNIEKSELWKKLNQHYSEEPFVNFTSGSGIYKYPQPKNVAGTNNAEIGFEVDEDRIVIFSAIDNLVKGSAGQAVQAANISLGIDQIKGLEFNNFHPFGVP